jgi:hypothetical protein
MRINYNAQHVLSLSQSCTTNTSTLVASTAQQPQHDILILGRITGPSRFADWT